MSFPKKLPARIARSGNIAAQIRTESTLQDTNGLGDTSRYIFVVENETSFLIFTARRHETTGRLCRVSLFTKIDYFHHAIANAVFYLIDDWKKHCSHEVVEVKINDDLFQGTVFAENMISNYPYLKDVVNAGRPKPAETPKIDPTARRSVRTSYSEWLSQQPNANHTGRYGPIMLA